MFYILKFKRLNDVYEAQNLFLKFQKNKEYNSWKNI